MGRNEGWNPGVGDAEAYWATDPEGFVCLERDGEPVGMGAIVSYADAFGYMGGAGNVPVQDVPLLSAIERLEEVALHKKQFRQMSEAEDPGVTGRQTTVKRIREGLQFTVGGLITFEPGSAELKNDARADIERISELIRGYNNKIEIRGHATGADVSSGSEFDNAWDLSYARAHAVAAFLCGDERGVRRERVRVVACGESEPLRQRVYDPQKVGVNRRVEIIVTENLVEEFQGEQPSPTVSYVETRG